MIGAKRSEFLFTYTLDDLVCEPARPGRNAFQTLISQKLKTLLGNLEIRRQSGNGKYYDIQFCI